MKPVSQLYEKYSNVAAHRENHFAKILGLPLFLGLKLNFTNLGYAIDESRNLRAEEAFQVLNGGQSVLHRIVQKAGCNRGFIQLHLGKNASHRHRVHEIWLTGHSVWPTDLLE
jgi:hypothetical protein